jgi:S1-C subfamily serine protease
VTRAALLSLVIVTSFAVDVQAQDDPADGTVFIRVVGNLRVLSGTDERVRREVLLDLQQRQVATGSGVIVSPSGLIVTNHHVISDDRIEIFFDGRPVEVAVEVQGVEVVLPSRAGAGGGPTRLAAAIAAVDPDLDLAVLFAPSSDLPYVVLGDSDVVTAGDPVRAIGYPLGQRIEIGKSAPGSMPDAAVSTGSISAFRRNDRGETRFLQTSAPLNPGNSGGPIVDGDGHVVGIAQSVFKNNVGLGFAIPINIVKTFLRDRGLDGSLPAPILTLGPYLDPSDRGIRLRVPDGYRDDSRFRLRIDASAGERTPSLHIDRIAGRVTLDQVEAALLQDGVLERYEAAGPSRRWVPRERASRKITTGLATGTDPSTGGDLVMLYALVDLGREKVIARYVGSRAAIAMNRSVLQASLESLDAAPLLTGELTRVVNPALDPSDVVVPGAGALARPDGWLIENGAPSSCAGLPPPQGGVSMSPAGDFTVQLRAAWWPGTLGDARQAARACSPRAGPLGEASYVGEGQWWGEPYEVRGAFVQAAGGFWQLELAAPVRKAALVSALFERWVAVNAGW